MSVITQCERCREYNAAAVDFCNQASKVHAALLALVEAVAWEREFDEVLVWLVRTGRYPKDMASRYDLANERECARAEVDRLLGEAEG